MMMMRILERTHASLRTFYSFSSSQVLPEKLHFYLCVVFTYTQREVKFYTQTRVKRK